MQEVDLPYELPDIWDEWLSTLWSVDSLCKSLANIHMDQRITDEEFREGLLARTRKHLDVVVAQRKDIEDVLLGKKPLDQII